MTYNPDIMSLFLVRRHSAKCKHQGKPGARTKLNCSCLLWVDGRINGKRVRESLETRNLQRARIKLVEIEAKGEDQEDAKTFAESAAAFLRHCEANLEPSSAIATWFGCFANMQLITESSWSQIGGSRPLTSTEIRGRSAVSQI